MNPTPRDVAEAFSHHNFTSTYDRLADDVRWRYIGGNEHVGKEAVVAACERSIADFAKVRTTFHSSRTVVGTDTVVVETLADYVDKEGTSKIGSCDLYDFVDGTVTTITSYSVEM